MIGFSSAIAVGAAGAATAGVGALAWTSLSPVSNFWGPVHSRGCAAAEPNRYAMTFDDGPTRDSTTAILDTLGELEVRAAFFVVGVNARRCPDLLVRMHAEGHLVGNHSLDHAHLAMFRGRRYWNRQVSETDEIIRQAIGVRPAMFRPPMGVKTCFVMDAAFRHGHAVITWSRRALDGITTTPDRILNRLVPHAVAGDVLILHDGVEPQSRRDPAATVAAIKPLVLGLRHRGLEPAPLAGLVGLPGYADSPTASSSRSPSLT